MVIWPVSMCAWTAVLKYPTAIRCGLHGAAQNILKIRLYGIDAPEEGQRYGRAATIFLTAACLIKA